MTNDEPDKPNDDVKIDVPIPGIKLPNNVLLVVFCILIFLTGVISGVIVTEGIVVAKCNKLLYEVQVGHPIIPNGTIISSFGNTTNISNPLI